MRPSVLLLREHQTARIAREWCPKGCTVTIREVRALDRLQRSTGKDYFDLRYNSIKATQWVGMVGIGNRAIEVVPKTDRADGPAARQNLVYMVSRAGLVPMSQVDAALLGRASLPLLLAYMSLYVRNLGREWLRSPVREYVSSERDRTCLKGRLLMAQQIRRNACHAERFYTDHDEFTRDNRIARVLKAALRVCEKQNMSGELRRSARLLLREFDEVEDVHVDRLRVDFAMVDRRNARYEVLLNMARFRLENVSPDSSSPHENVYSLMFDMNMVFERFVLAEVRRALRNEDLRVKAQQRSRHLLRCGGKPRFALKPDIGIYRSGKPVCLIDAKWKLLDMGRRDHGVSQADMYQMYAYGKEYDSPRVLVLYPGSSEHPARLITYEHAADPLRLIEIAALDVSGFMQSPSRRQRLGDKIRELLRCCG